MLVKQLKFPEARDKVEHYRDIVSNLKTHQRCIQNYIERARIVNDTELEAQDVDGVYYDFYIQKRDEWIQLQQSYIKKFDEFLEELNNCIDKAKGLEELWNNRIGLLEYEDRKDGGRFT